MLNDYAYGGGLGNRKHEEESQPLDAESRTPLKFLHYGRAGKTVVNVSPRGTFGGLSLDDPEIMNIGKSRVGPTLRAC